MSVALPLRLVLGLALAAATAGAQPVPAGVVFDDFVYLSTEWRMAVQRDQPDGTPSADMEGAEGSLYGPNLWWTPDGEIRRRAWYRYGWQEIWHSSFAGTLDASPAGLWFRLPAGNHAGDHCPDPGGEGRVMIPQQIVSGFVARRGVWATRLQFGTLADASEGVHIQAFWLVSNAFGRMRTPEGDVPVWNEVDHEFNNAFRGTDQPHPYNATSVRSGPGHRVAWVPMGPDSPEAGHPDGCMVTRHGRTHTESEAACMARLANPSGRQEPVWAILLIRVADDGVVFELVAQDGDDRLSMVSPRHAPAPVLPLGTLLSQHLAPHAGACGERIRLAEDAEMEVDWVYYSSDPSTALADVTDGVSAFRARGIRRAITDATLSLERPTRHYSAEASGWGLGSRTTPLTLRLDGPSLMSPGEQAQVVALPPLRHGLFRVLWTVTRRLTDGPLVTESVPGFSFALPVDFPPGTDTLIVRARLEEVTDEGVAIYTDVVQPVEATLRIVRR